MEAMEHLLISRHKEGLLTDQEVYNRFCEYYASDQGFHLKYCDYFWMLRDRLIEEMDPDNGYSF